MLTILPMQVRIYVYFVYFLCIFCEIRVWVALERCSRRTVEQEDCGGALEHCSCPSVLTVQPMHASVLVFVVGVTFLETSRF